MAGKPTAYSTNHVDLTIATELHFADVITEGFSDGSFASILPGTSVSIFTPLQINQPHIVVPAGTFWAVGGFTFTASTLVEQFNNANTLSIYGTGIFSDGNPANNSFGEFVATFNKSGTNFTWSASSSASGVPDGGSTALIFGSALAALFAVVKYPRRA